MAVVEPLCLCGIRGCPLAVEHLASFGPAPKHRFWHRRKP